MRLQELQFELPRELIAQQAVEPRDAARLLVLDRGTGRIEHRRFRDISEYLRAGDRLVLNDTRVISARFFARRATGGGVECLFLHEEADGWRVMLKPAGRIRAGELLICAAAGGQCLRAIRRLERGEWLLQPEPPAAAVAFLDQFGQTPLPPYIEREGRVGAGDQERYQTVYAARAGAVAAPTAGLHFTPELLAALGERRIGRSCVTLHVGAGTFAPIEVADLRGHVMHAEWFEIGAAAATEIEAAQKGGGRIVAVGTTSVRVLESAATEEGNLRAANGWTRIFIYPPYRFRVVDALITNFHLPGSTLLALAMAFATPELIRAAYKEAIREQYRFYSYGDAMLIL